MQKQFITCPQCGTEIDVNAVLYQNISKELERKYAEKEGEAKKEYESKLAEIKKTEADIEKRERELNDRISAGVSEKLKAEKSKLESELRSEIKAENDDTIKSLQSELNKKSEQIKELNQAKADIERLKREKDEIASEINLAKEKELSEKLAQEREKLSKQLHDENYLKEEEYKKKISDLTVQAAELKRQAEQGSMQFQGEIQELVIEQELRNIYPLDKIEEIKKGVSGADILQTVVSNTGAECGKIYYESKRTKAFNQEWIKKLKDDNLQENADALVIITEALPNGNTFSFIDGVYVVSFNEFKAVSMFIRNFLLKLAENNVSNANKGTKAELLYDYLVSNEFKANFEAIVSNFKDLKDSLYQEKLRTEKVFKQREKQIDTILTNIVGFHGSIRGIAGAQVADVMLIENEQKNLIE
ncbi:MAG: DUF2130 domain-containing protein [bacterium]